tara:strand:+ start:887 stop:1246 length:360 start_codon:yes stop_codon:yes gene_type:complete
MATRKLESMGDRGERKVAQMAGPKAKRTAKKAPFDVVDYAAGVAYEVKTVSQASVGRGNKIHIETAAWNRKMDFLAETGLTGKLMVVVYFNRRKVEVYRMDLVKHVRITAVLKNAERMD